MKGVKRFLRFNGEETALTNYTIGEDLTYCQLTEGIVYIHQLLAQHGISAHDRVIITNEGTAEWAIKLVGAVTYGAVVVVVPYGVDMELRTSLMRESGACLDFDTVAVDKDFTELSGSTPADFSVCDYSLGDVIMIDYSKDLTWRKLLGGEALRYEEVRVSDIIRVARGIRSRYDSLRHSRIPSLFLANNASIDAADVLVCLHLLSFLNGERLNLSCAFGRNNHFCSLENA